MGEKQILLGVFLLIGVACLAAEGYYVGLDSFDIDLKSKSLTFYFTSAVDLHSLIVTQMRFISSQTTNQFTLSGGTPQLLNQTTVMVTMLDTDAANLVNTPGLCVNRETCTIGYYADLIRGIDGGPTFPGFRNASDFVPYPLHFERFGLDLNHGYLMLTFNRNVSSSSVNASTLTLFSRETASSHEGYIIQYAECVKEMGCTDGPSVNVSLSDVDLNIIKSNATLCTDDSNCFALIHTKLVTDLGGYPLQFVDEDTSSVVSVHELVPDTTQPEIVAYGLDFTEKTLYLQFSESVNCTTFDVSAGDLFIHHPAVENFTLDVYVVGETTLLRAENQSTVVILNAVSVIDTIVELMPREKLYQMILNVNGSIVRDFAMNALQLTDAAPLYLTVGVEALVFTVSYHFVYDTVSEALRISFPCEAPLLYPGNNFTVFESEPNNANLNYSMETEYCGGFGNDLVCYLTHDQVKTFVGNDRIATNKDNLNAVVESFCNLEGPVLVSVDEIEADTTAAKLVSFTMDMKEGKLQLTFDSLLSSMVDVTQVKLQKEELSDADSVSLSANSRYEVINWLVDIHFTNDDLALFDSMLIAQSITTSYVSLEPLAASDLYGNRAEQIPAHAALIADRFIGSTPPMPTTLDSFTFDCTTGLLQLTFSQAVYTATLDLNKITLMNERTESYEIWRGDFAIDYVSVVDITLSSFDFDQIRSRNGFLVSSNHIFLAYLPELVYDVNDELLVSDGSMLKASGDPVACSCPEGFTLTRNGLACVDIDECSEAGTGGIQSCDHTCTNTDGSYYCSCNDGYRLQPDQHTCLDIDECEEGLHNCSQICVNDPGSHHCACNTTEYALSRSDSRSCLSIDHCVATAHNCDQHCVDDFGTYRCVCDPGYRLAADEHTCQDIDECAEGTANCNQDCTNTVASYSCACYSGYEFSRDGYTCIDVNECLSFNGDCAHNCHNVNGSHSCSCRHGYTLQQNGRTCVADPCNSTLSDPEYGSVMCTGAQVTDTMCTFSCQAGFYVEGSPSRTCLGDQTWSGEPVTCERLSCVELGGFYDAAVKQPCDNHYNSSCTIECLPAYFNPSPDMNFMTCVVSSEVNNTVQWTEKPYCQEREPCLPSPCQHGASCSEVQTTSGGQALCNCSGTGYTGEHCHIGVISVPGIPFITTAESHDITISAYPDSDLRVEVTTDIPSSPQVLLFTPSVTSVVVTLSPNVSGLFTLAFNLGGTSGLGFQQPSVRNVIVRSADIPPGIDDIIAPSCCSDESRSVHTCPNGEELVFTSTCQHRVDTWPANTRILQGVSFVRTSELSLPLSIGSVSLQPSGSLDLSYSFSPYTGEEQCLSCQGDASTCGGREWNCTCFSPSADITASYLVEESLAKTFLSGVRNLLPDWIQLEALGSNRVYHNDFSYHTKLLDAEELLSMEECGGFYPVRTQDLGTYAVLVYYGEIVVGIGNDTVRHSPTESDAFCVAVNVCEGTASPVLLSLPRSFPVENFPAHSSLSAANWKVEDIFGVIVNIDEELETVSRQPSVAVYGRVSHRGSLGSSNTVELSFEGLIGLETGDVLEVLTSEEVPSFSGFMTGRTQLTLNSSGQILQLQGLEATTQIKFNGSAKEAEPCSSHHSLKLTLSQWTITEENNIFNSLLSDGGLFSCPLDIEMKMTSGGQLYDFTFTTSCHLLTLNNFVFPGMYHQLHLLHSSSQLLGCSSAQLPVGDFEPHQLAVVSRLKEGGSTPFSWFLDFNGPKDQPSILTLIDPVKKSFSASTIQDTAVLKLLDQSVFVSLSISSSEITFETELEVVNALSTLTGVATAATYASVPSLQIYGSLKRGSIHTGMENAAIYILTNNVDRPLRLISAATSSVQAASILKEHFALLKNSSMSRKSFVETEFLRVRELRQRAEVQYQGHSVLVVLDGTRWQSTELVTTLDQFCSLVDNCVADPYSSMVCKKCSQIAVPFTRRWFANTECISRVNKAVHRQEYVVKHRLDQVEGPHVGFLSCDSSQDSFWEDPSFGCSVVKIKEGVRSIYVQSNRSEEWVDYMTEETSYACERPLQEQSEWSMDHFCCGLETDTTLHNADCLSWNVGCRLGRKMVMESFADTAPSEALDLYSKLDGYLQDRILAQIEESIAIEDLRSAEKTLGMASYFHLQAEDLLNWREAREREMWMRYQGRANDTNHTIAIDSIYFNLTLDSKPPTTIPLEVSYSANNCSNNTLVFDFLVSSIQPSIIAGANQLAKSALEGGCPQTFRSATDFGSYCKNLQDMSSVVEVIIRSLEHSKQHYNNASDDASGLVNDLNNILHRQSLWEIPPAWLSSTAAPQIDAQQIYSGVNASEELAAYQRLFDRLSANAPRDIEIADQYVFVKWLLYMDQEVGGLMGAYNCTGMVECLTELSSVLESLLLVANTDWSEQMLEELQAASEDLLSVVWQHSVRSVDELRAKCSKMETLVQNMLGRDYWCELTPETDVEMSRPSPVEAGSDPVNLTCSFSSNFTGHYQWLKNGITLPGQTSRTLQIPDVSLESAGVYTCSVQTHKGEDISTSVSVEVHQAPQFTLQAVNVTVFPEEGAVFLRCNSSGHPTPKWKWFFQSPLSSSPVELEGETRSELVINPPGEDKEGWYFCEASNVVNMSRASPGAYLRVLESRVAVLATPGEVVFSSGSRKKRASDDINQDYVAISPDEQNSVANLTELLIHTQFSSNSSVVVKEGQLTVDDLSNNIKLTFLLSSEELERSSEQTIEDTLHEIAQSRMEWQMVVSAVSEHITNQSVYDYSGVVAGEANVLSGSVQEGSLVSRCPEGYELKRDSNLFCVSCPPGSYQTYSVESLSSTVTLTYPTCKLCPLGHYQISSGTSSCLPCPLGHHSSILGATQCSACLPGNHQPLTGQAECALCPKGHIQATSAQDHCLPCPMGYHLSTAGGTQCSSCLPGTYQPLEGQAECELCPRGFFQPTSNQSVCLPCPRGYRSSMEGSSQCSTCLPGNYQPLEGQAECELCPQGSIQPSQGQNRCLPCPPGYNISAVGGTQCGACPPGNHQPIEGQPECDLCPLGSVQPTAGQDRCLPCPPGQHFSTVGGTHCSACLPGNHQPLFGQSECVLCPGGHFQPSSGQPDCLPCPLGHNQSTSGQLSCDDCPDSHYQDERGRTACKMCPTGHLHNATVLGGAIDVRNCTCVENCALPQSVHWVMAPAIGIMFAVGVCLVVLVFVFVMYKGSYRTKKHNLVQPDDSYVEKAVQLTGGSLPDFRYTLRKENATNLLPPSPAFNDYDLDARPSRSMGDLILSNKEIRRQGEEEAKFKLLQNVRDAGGVKPLTREERDAITAKEHWRSTEFLVDNLNASIRSKASSELYDNASDADTESSEESDQGEAMHLIEVKPAVPPKLPPLRLPNRAMEVAFTNHLAARKGTVLKVGDKAFANADPHGGKGPSTAQIKRQLPSLPHVASSQPPASAHPKTP